MSGTPAPAAGDRDPALRPFRRALVGVDIQPNRRELLGPTLRIAHQLADDLLVVHVVLRPTSAASNESDGTPANSEETAIVREIRTAATTGLGERGRVVPIQILHGDPAQRLSEYAAYAECDVLVLGPRGRTSLARAFRGSVVRAVLAASRAPVLVLGDLPPPAAVHTSGPTS